MRLPPLNAIRAFEAAARYSSFTRAADELCVTPGAISRQVRSLEEYFGKPLFLRSYREVTLTDSGRTYAATLSDAFRQVDAATRAFAAATDQPTLTIYSPITLTLHWLIRRLPGYHALHPEQGIRISSEGLAPTTLTGTDFDIALRLAGGGGGLDAIPLFDVRFVVVCSPRFLEQSGVTSPADLPRHPLLVSERRSKDWENWFRAARVPAPDLSNEVEVQSSALAYQGAADGVGFAVAMDVLVEEEIARGTLVQPFDIAFADGLAFHAVYPIGADAEPATRGFLDWIADETAPFRTGAARGAPVRVTVR